MLRRTSFMSKRKDKKSEIERAVQMIKQLIEKRLQDKNEKTVFDLNPNFILPLSESEDVIKNFKADIENFV